MLAPYKTSSAIRPVTKFIANKVSLVFDYDFVVVLVYKWPSKALHHTPLVGEDFPDKPLPLSLLGRARCRTIHRFGGY